MLNPEQKQSKPITYTIAICLLSRRYGENEADLNKNYLNRMMISYDRKIDALIRFYKWKKQFSNMIYTNMALVIRNE